MSEEYGCRSLTGSSTPPQGNGEGSGHSPPSLLSSASIPDRNNEVGCIPLSILTSQGSSEEGGHRPLTSSSTPPQGSSKENDCIALNIPSSSSTNQGNREDGSRSVISSSTPVPQGHIEESDRILSTATRAVLSSTAARALEYNNPKQYSTGSSFQVGILAKLDIIIENQQEQLALLRQIAANSNHSSGVDCLEELNALTIDSVAGLLELDDKLSDNEFKKKMLNVLSITGGTKLTETVRKIMRKVATNKVWSLFSFRGRQGKQPFIDLRICRLVAPRLYRKAKESEIEDAIAEFLRNAPHRPGGSKFEPRAKMQPTVGRARDARSESDTE